MIEQKGCGNKKINRVNVSLTNKVNKDLNRLAIACNMRPTTLAGLCIELVTSSPELINMLQDKYNVHSSYRIIPINHKGDVKYGK